MQKFVFFTLAFVPFFISCDDNSGDDRYFINPDLEAGCLGLQYPDMTLSEFIVPWEVGKSYEVTGNCNTHGGARGIQNYAYDIDMPIGTSIVASRSGTVVGVEEEFADFNGSVHQLNYVFIQHADKTIARYYHLTTEGVLVEANDEVVQGQAIGLSGGSGDPGYAHLHFDLVSKECIDRINLGGNFDIQISCQTTAVVFSNTRTQDRGLEIGEFYEALPY